MKTALITGGARRIGKAITLGLAERGYAVAIHYNNSEEEAAALAKRISDAGGSAAIFKADLSELDETEGLIDAVCAGLSSPTCLVNNASSFVHDTTHDFAAGGWEAQHNTNLRAPALLSRDFARAIADGEGGCIINIIDQRIASPTPTFFTYMMSKSGLETLTRLTAIALAPKIRVCAVAPGLTLRSGAQSQDQFEASHGQTLLGRGSSADDIVDAVLYLIEAETVTGQILFVDGGERFKTIRNDDDLIERN